MWSKDQLAKFRRALATATKHREALAKLAELGKHSPGLAETVKDLQTRAEYTETIAKLALELQPDEPTPKK